MLSPLQLDEYFIDNLKIETIYPQEKTDKKPVNNVKIEWDTFEYIGNKNLFKIIFNVKVNTDKKKKPKFGYVLELIASGIFSINQEDLEEKDKQGLISYNAPAILYSAMRGYISLITGNSFFGPLHIPTLNIMEIAKLQSKRKKKNL